MAFTVHAVDRIKFYSLNSKLLSTNYVPSGVRIARRSPQFRSGHCGRRWRHAAARPAVVKREPRPSIPEAQEASCNASDWATTTSSIPAAAQPLHRHRRSPALVNGEITHDLQGKGCLITLPGRWRALHARGAETVAAGHPRHQDTRAASATIRPHSSSKAVTIAMAPTVQAERIKRLSIRERIGIMSPFKLVLAAVPGSVPDP